MNVKTGNIKITMKLHIKKIPALHPFRPILNNKSLLIDSDRVVFLTHCGQTILLQLFFNYCNTFIVPGLSIIV